MSSSFWLTLVALVVVGGGIGLALAILVRRRFQNRMQAIQERLDHLQEQASERRQETSHLHRWVGAVQKDAERRAERQRLEIQILQIESLLHRGQDEGTVSEQLAQEVRRQLQELNEEVAEGPD